MTYYLAIDIGASSGRHILGRMEDGKLVMEEIYRFENFEFETLLSLYQIMMKETQKQKKDSACLLENTYQMIMKLMERNAELYFGKNEKIQGNHLVSAALNIIENYYYTHLTLKEISHRLSVSSSLLDRKSVV